MIQDSIAPVLVNEDTIYRREDHAKRLLLYGRPPQVQGFSSLWPQHQPQSVYLNQDDWQEQVHRPPNPESALYPFRQIAVTQPSGQPLFLLTNPRPSPDFFADRFVGVYPVVEAYSQTATTFFSPPQPPFLCFNNNRPAPSFFEDHSLETGQTNHPFPYVIQIGIGLFPYSFEVADLNADPWLEQVHRPANPELALYPFRQIYPQQTPQQIMLQMFYKAPNWRVESEPIWNVPATNQQTLGQFRWQSITPILPNVIGDTLAAATAALNFAGFFNTNTVSIASAQPVGTVIAQSPSAGPVGSFNVSVLLTLSAGIAPAGTVIMPNVVGVILQQALVLLQNAGVLVPAAIGYFGTYPVTVKFIPSTSVTVKDATYIGDFGVVHAQSIAAGIAVTPNTPITLICSEFPANVTFP
jgi:hypothetical protein